MLTWSDLGKARQFLVSDDLRAMLAEVPVSDRAPDVFLLEEVEETFLSTLRDRLRAPTSAPGTTTDGMIVLSITPRSYRPSTHLCTLLSRIQPGSCDRSDFCLGSASGERSRAGSRTWRATPGCAASSGPRRRRSGSRAAPRLKASGSSRLIVWPALGRTTSPDVGILRFMKIAGSRHGSSSSPVMIRVGTSRRSIGFSRSKTEGRVICTPRIVSAWPFADPRASWSWNSCQPMGSLSMNCTRVGPLE